jgi:predicted DNA-binding transcriptional regulator AlpA
MTPAPRRKPAVYDPGPVRLAAPPDVGPIDPPEDPRPEPKRGPTLPAGFDPQPEAPARPQGGSPRGRTLPASIEPMLHIDDLAALLSCSRRLVERMRSAGKVPKPDIHVGRCPRWKPATIRAWIERGGK